MSEKNIAKYLNQYAETEVDILENFSEIGVFDYVITVPMYQESYDFIAHFAEQFSDSSVLLIVILNQPDSDDDNRPQNELLQQFRNNNCLIEQHQHLSFYRPKNAKPGILLIARYEEPLRIPAKSGVGLARKIATDCAVKLIAGGRVKHQMIGTTDADAALPENYFTSLQLSDSISAAVFDFEHVVSGDRVVDAATNLYEQRLNYYVCGLQYAESGYAFHTIGSCIAVHYASYAQVRGFPKKSGGEDFYLLNKLAKLGKIVQLDAKIAIRSRLSARVPFGTGPAVAEIVANNQSESEYLVYDPHVFEELKALLKTLSKLELSNVAIQEDFTEPCYRFLADNGFFQQMEKWGKQYKSNKQLQKAINDWFDAFRTLKFVHFCRDMKFPNIPLEEAQKIRLQLGF